MMKTRNAMWVAAVLLTLGQAGHAVVISFTDIVSFNAATNTTLVEDFEAIVPLNVVASFVSNGNTYTGLAGVPILNVAVSTNGQTNFGLGAVGTPSQVLTANGDEDFTVDFGSPSNALGFDTYLNTFGNGDATVQVFGAGNTLLDTIVHNHAADTIGFLGLLADEPIHSIRWTTVNGAVINTGIDNILQGDAIIIDNNNNNNAVPEPITATLGLMSLTALGIATRRRVA